MQEISQKARQVLEYLTQRESSIPPTVREIGAALQIKSTSTVHKYLTELAAAGYIEKGDKMNRAISLPQQQSAKVPLLGVVTARIGWRWRTLRVMCPTRAAVTPPMSCLRCGSAASP